MSKFCFKIIIIGDMNVGKTSLINRYVNNKFHENYKSTIGVDLYKKELKFNTNRVSLQIWDTAGAERFQSIAPSFYRGCDACVLVFDLTNSKSFNSLEQWIDEFLIYSNPRNPESFPLILLGNKSDLENTNNININQARIDKFCKMRKIKYFSVSAKNNNNNNICTAFNYLVNIMMNSETDSFDSNEIIEYNSSSYRFYNEDLNENYDKKINLVNTTKIHYVYPEYSSMCYC